MKKIIVQLFIISFVLSCSSNSEDFTYPKSKKINFTEILHGVEISDPYRWLEDFTSAESIDWINRQDDFCLLYTSPSPRDRTRSRMPSSA